MPEEMRYLTALSAGVPMGVGRNAFLSRMKIFFIFEDCV